MIVKIVTFFLIFVAVLGMFGKLRLLVPKRLQKVGRCKTCGAHKIGKGPCACKQG